jgi:alpha-tubulin suppressor-like RCC1 family protein
MSVLLRTIRPTMTAVERLSVPWLIAILAGMIVAFSIVLVPAEASSPLKVIAIATGHEHTCALMINGGVKCWGFNGSNQLGVFTGKSIYTYKPLYVRGLTSGAKAVVAGNQHSCAITSRSGVKCWGANFKGTIGNGGGLGTRTRSGGVGWRTPVDVRGLTSGVTALSSSYEHVCALTNAGAVKCWGWTFRGDGSTTQTNPIPFTVPGLAGIKAIASGAIFNCALTGTGGVKCWGALRMSASSDYSFVPVDIPGLTSGVKAIAAGNDYACALMVGGGVKCWGGDNQYGELGNGTAFGRVWPPSNVAGLTSGVTAIAAGSEFTCALTTQGGVKCWGNNGNGQLGNNPAPNKNVAKYSPVDVYGLRSGVRAIAAGFWTACAVMRNGGAKCWGNNGFGMLGNRRVRLNANSAKPVNVQFGS